MEKKPVNYYVVDAFTEEAYSGNPAVICLLQEDRSEKWLQSVASEFNIMTAFLKAVTPDVGFVNPRFHLRMFTPTIEVNLCGHATLAASYILFSKGIVDSIVIEFETISGLLPVRKISTQSGLQGSFYVELDFPAAFTVEPNSTDLESLQNMVGKSTIVDVKRTSNFDDIMVEVLSMKEVQELRPNFDELMKYSGRGLIVTSVCSAESEFDFCSRAFFPKYGVLEDPVCGTAHCALGSYWSKKLRKSDFVAYAASARGGTIALHFDETNKRMLMRGKAVTVMEGTLLM